MVSSPSHAIELLGGYKSVAVDISRPPTTVASWAIRESIPVSIWPILVSLAQRKTVREITYEALVKAHVGAEKGNSSPKRRRSRAA